MQGQTPDVEVALAPTQHPLATLAGILASPLSIASDAGVHGEPAQTATLILAFVALALLGWVVYALGHRVVRPVGRRPRGRDHPHAPAGARLRRARLRRHPVRRARRSARCSSRRGARGRALPVLVLLAVAGLIRPEAWLFSAAYLVYLVWRGERDARAPRDARRRRRERPGAVGADRLGARRLAAALADRHARHRRDARPRDRPGRRAARPSRGASARSCASRCCSAPSAGCVLSWLWLRDRGAPAIVAGVLALAAFCVLAASGLPILGRYLLLPAAIGAILGGAGAFGWTELPREDPWRVRWMALAALTVALTLAFVPSQVTRLKNTRSALITQTHILDELHDLAVDRLPADASCSVWVPNRRAVPQIALWTDRRPSAIRSAQEDRRYGTPAFVPQTPAIADQFVLDARDKDKTLPPAPRATGAVERSLLAAAGPIGDDAGRLHAARSGGRGDPEPLTRRVSECILTPA